MPPAAEMKKAKGKMENAKKAEELRCRIQERDDAMLKLGQVTAKLEEAQAMLAKCRNRLARIMIAVHTEYSPFEARLSYISRQAADGIVDAGGDYVAEEIRRTLKALGMERQKYATPDTG